jgi:hypothetical protein
MRWSGPGVVAAAAAEGLLAHGEEASLGEYARGVAADPGVLPPDTPEGRAPDSRLAELAVTVALRRHGRPGSPASAPRPLTDVRIVVGSGGVLRHGDGERRRQVLSPAVSDHGGGWRVPAGARAVVDDRYVLFAAGLLATEHPQAAAGLARRVLLT